MVTLTSLSTLTYPRTGKRGVPQQFPRRLFEMLESETKLASASTGTGEAVIISWSASGKAFRIADVDSFVATVLPKYFRTKKFSSFQRNLNLYGFTKIRRGPDTDMYTHPSFMRGRPELLSQLRKLTPSPRRRVPKITKSPIDESDASSSEGSMDRSVSPSPPRTLSTRCFRPVVHSRIQKLPCQSQYVNHQGWFTFSDQSSYSQDNTIPSVSLLPTPKKDGTGRLDLLALVIEREECFA